MVDKEECKRLYRELKEDIADLESDNFRKLWFERLDILKKAGCWWHYAVLKRKARDYMRGKGEYHHILNFKGV